MIKINLLPTKRKKKSTPVPTFLIGGLLLMVVAVVGSVYAVYFFNARINDLKDQKQANGSKIEELNRKIKEVKGFEQRNNVFLERKRIIEELTKNQSLPVKILDEMAKRLTEGVWLSSMNISRGMVKISGVGFTNSDIVAYVHSLKGSGLFSNVLLLGTSHAEVSGATVYNFNITFKVNV